MPLPPGGWDGTVIQSRVEFNDTKRPESVPVPVVDPIQSQFSKEYLSIRFTIEFLRKANAAMGSIGHFGLRYNGNVNAAVWLYDDLADRPFFFTSDDAMIKDVISFYSTNFLGLFLLDNKLVEIEKKQIEELQKHSYVRKGKKEQISPELAKSFVDFVKREIDKYLNDAFANMSMRLAVTYGKLTVEGQTAKTLLENNKVRAFLEVIKNAEAYKRVLGAVPRCDITKPRISSRCPTMTTIRVKY